MICGGATMLRGSVNFTVLDCFGFCIFFLLQATYLGCHGPEEKTAAKLLILLPTLVLSLYPRLGAASVFHHGSSNPIGSSTNIARC